MRADRYRSLQQRLRRETDAFEFGALIDGVSTIEHEKADTERARRRVPSAPDEVAPADAAPPDMVDEAPVAVAPPPPAPTPLPEPDAVAAPVAAAAPGPAQRESVDPPPVEVSADRVRVAMEALESRLLQAAGRFRSAAVSGNAEEAGLRLADMNQILALLHTVDPTGDTARRLVTCGAPPLGRPWPGPVWTVAELAESPLSGLLPSTAPEPFVRAVMYAAWGVTFE